MFALYIRVLGDTPPSSEFDKSSLAIESAVEFHDSKESLLFGSVLLLHDHKGSTYSRGANQNSWCVSFSS